MSKMNKVLACIQVLIFLGLMLCSSSTTILSPGKSGGFPCKELECGCKSEADCKAHCCCSPQGNRSLPHHDVKKQKNSFRSFISSLKCKSGSDAITFINTELTYILEDYCLIPRITFSCFLTGDTLAHLREPMVSPPEKPPRCLA